MISYNGHVNYPPTRMPRREAAESYRQAWDQSLKRNANGSVDGRIRFLQPPKPPNPSKPSASPFNRIIEMWTDEHVFDVAVIAQAVGKTEEIVTAILKSQNLR